jgi:T5SS/PEP-CTERM-associated repeat protein
LGSLLVTVVPAHAVLRIWDPVGFSFDWHTATNWDPTGVPTTDDSVQISGGLTTLSADTAGVNSLVMTGGLLQSNGHTLNVDNGGSGQLTIDGLAGSAPSLALFPTGDSSDALVADMVRIQDGGSLVLSNDGVTARVDTDMVIGAGGTLRASGAGAKTLTFTADVSPVLVNDGTISVNGGGIFTLTTSVTGAGTSFDLDGANETGVIQVSSGELRTDARFTDAFDGLATVTGTGAVWTSDFDLRFGGTGMGTLSIADGGSVQVRSGTIGQLFGSAGTVTVAGTGSIWTNTDFLTVGEGGTGTLTIEAGGSVESNDGIIGFSGSTGTATVTGAGSTWDNSEDLRIGDAGMGTLSIADGGSVQDRNGRIGDVFGATGTVTVTGAGSTWTNSSQLGVGTFGKGELTISNGGSVSNTLGSIGNEAGSTGEVTVTGAGSTWSSNSELRVGNMGMGDLTIADGGSVSFREGSIGRSSGSVGMAAVTGVGSMWTVIDDLFVGRVGAGTLLIEAGGGVSNTDGFIASRTGSVATVTVTGAGSTWNNSGNLSLGGDGSGPLQQGAGTLTIEDGGTVIVGSGIVSDNADSQINLDSDGVLDVHGGILMRGGEFNFMGGTLVADTISEVNGGTLVNQGGTLAPRNGGFDPQVGSFSGIGVNYAQQAAGTLQIEIGASVPGLVDRLVVVGNVLLNGAVEVELLDGFMPTLGNTFTIMQTELLDFTFGEISGQFNTIVAPVVDGLTFDVIYNPTSVVLEVVEATGLPGDYNQDGLVNAADYVVWRNHEGTAFDLPNRDPEAMGNIDQADYQFWVDNFGSGSGSGSSNPHSAFPGTLCVPPSTAVPEPAGSVLVAVAGSLLLFSSLVRGPRPTTSSISRRRRKERFS